MVTAFTVLLNASVQFPRPVQVARHVELPSQTENTTKFHRLVFGVDVEEQEVLGNYTGTLFGIGHWGDIAGYCGDRTVWFGRGQWRAAGLSNEYQNKLME